MDRPAIMEGGTDGRGLPLAIIVARFNELVTERLLDGALKELAACQVARETVTVIRVPGAFEIPVAVKNLLDSGRFSAIICLGAVIRGESAHFEYVCKAALDGIAALARESGVPITNGIITALNMEQAMERSGSPARNLGTAAARAAVEMATLLKKVRA